MPPGTTPTQSPPDPVGACAVLPFCLRTRVCSVLGVYYYCRRLFCVVSLRVSDRHFYVFYFKAKISLLWATLVLSKWFYASSHSVVTKLEADWVTLLPNKT